MESGNSYRLLQLKRILATETDRNHSLAMREIQEKLKYLTDGVSYDYRTIKSDLNILGKLNFEIIKKRGKHGKILYSHQERLFEVYELRLMIDAILSARFVTKDDKESLINKLKQLTSTHIAKTLPVPVFVGKSGNINYERMKLNIDFVHRGIIKERVLTYQYGRFNINKQFEYSRDGDWYYVEPYALTWQNDYYYLIGYFQETEEFRHYRLDRIRNITLSAETFKKQNFEVENYINQSFNMFSGEKIRFHIRFNNELINVVLDRFGLDAQIKKDGKDFFILTAKGKLSVGLISWILKYGHKAQVLSPDHLVEKVKTEVEKMYQLHN